MSGPNFAEKDNGYIESVEHAQEQAQGLEVFEDTAVAEDLLEPEAAQEQPAERYQVEVRQQGQAPQAPQVAEFGTIGAAREWARSQRIAIGDHPPNVVGNRQHPQQTPYAIPQGYWANTPYNNAPYRYRKSVDYTTDETLAKIRMEILTEATKLSMVAGNTKSVVEIANELETWLLGN
jgi:hypothetical protein